MYIDWDGFEELTVQAECGFNRVGRMTDSIHAYFLSRDITAVLPSGGQ